MKVGVLTGGGDCPGVNSIIRSVVRSGVVNISLRWLLFIMVGRECSRKNLLQ